MSRHPVMSGHPINVSLRTEFASKREIDDSMNIEYKHQIGGMQNPLYGLDISIVFQVFEDGFMAFDYDTKELFRFNYPLGVSDLMLYNKLLNKFYRFKLQEAHDKAIIYEEKYRGLLRFIQDITVNRYRNFMDIVSICRDIIMMNTGFESGSGVSDILIDTPTTYFSTPKTGVLDSKRFINPFSPKSEKSIRKKVKFIEVNTNKDTNEEDTNKDTNEEEDINEDIGVSV